MKIAIRRLFITLIATPICQQSFHDVRLFMRSYIIILFVKIVKPTLCLFWILIPTIVFSMGDNLRKRGARQNRLANAYLEFQRGDLPIILVAPHAGNERPINISTNEPLPARECRAENFPEDCYDAEDGETTNVGKCCRGGSCSLVKSDGKTYELTKFLAQEIERVFGRKPYYVISNVKREFVDFNRDAYSFKTRFHENHPGLEPLAPRFCSFDDPGGYPHWDAFHNKIEEYVANINTRFGTSSALLFDIHGNSRSNYQQILAIGVGTWYNSEGRLQVGETLPNMRANDETLPCLFRSIRGFVPRLVYQFQAERLLNSFPVTVDVYPSYRTHTDYALKGGFDVQRYSRVYAAPASGWGGPQSSATLPKIDSIQLEYGEKLRKCQNRNGSWSYCDSSVQQSARATAQALYDAREFCLPGY